MSPFAPSRHSTRPTRRGAVLAGSALALALSMLAGGDAQPTAARSDYLLMPRSELRSLPTSGKAWAYIVEVAHSGWEAPELDDQDNQANVQALAAALVYARTGDTSMRTKARNALVAMIPTYDLSVDEGLGPARQIAGWVLVADFIGLGGGDDDAFRGLLRRALTHRIGSHPRWGGSLAVCQEDSDNNWGAWCSASRIAAALYLHDTTTLARAERVFRGFLGDRKAWSHFRGQGSENGLLTAASRSWSCNAAPSAYVPTNPSCGNRSGAFPSDAGRLGSYRKLDAMYQSETTAAVVLSTELLYQNGYPHEWGFRGALARIARFDASHGAWNLGTVQKHWPWLINRRLGTSYPTVPARYGRSLGYTDWLYGQRTSSGGGGGGGGGGPGATPRPTRTSPPGSRPRPTNAPGGGAGNVRTSDSGQGANSPAAASALADGTKSPAPLSSAAGAAPFGGASANGPHSGYTNTTLGGAAGSPLRQLVSGGLLIVVAMWTVAFIRARFSSRSGSRAVRPRSP